jgi:hypothetical protein|nr:MAG TPA: Tripartite Tc toxins repeat [Caudoviricetes sp.]
MNKTVKYPCINCIYFDACGNTNRIEPCLGRMTKSEKKGEVMENETYTKTNRIN